MGSLIFSEVVSLTLNTLLILELKHISATKFRKKVIFLGNLTQAESFYLEKY